VLNKVLLYKEASAGVAQLAEQLICNQQVAGSSPIASSTREGFPSGQRGQTVNLLATPSEVRILPPPPPVPTDGESIAGIAQLVEHQPSKLRVAGSIPVSRSRKVSPARTRLNCLACLKGSNGMPSGPEENVDVFRPRSSVGRALPW
jgi:hypothetical protein